ncbi:MAG TPA: hypothetical protein VFK54_04060 [Candidatus Limnocylindrales bacterium]|nr:hypothetical protein [Candidatus Limnocylindrales bacterium]
MTGGGLRIESTTPVRTTRASSRAGDGDRAMTPFESWVLELGAGERCRIDSGRYVGALLVVLHGTLWIHTRAEACGAFGAGSFITPCWVDAVAFENPGPDALRLLGIARRTTIARADD